MILPHRRKSSAVKKSLPVILEGQNDSGLWGIEYGKKDHLISSAWHVRALYAAQRTGVDKKVLLPSLKRAVNAMKKWINENPQDQFLAPAVLSLQLTGYGHSPECRKGIESLQDLSLDWKNPGFENPVSQWYFAAQAAFHGGGKTWARWNRSAVAALIKNQQVVPEAIQAPYRDGKHDIGYWSSPGNKERYRKAYSTALCCLMLEVYYAYRPFKPVRLEKEEDIETADDVQIEIDI